ncbi:LysR family transcriptional regulator [Sulfitobacter sp. M368]|uniref:LysR family transcriptional regulator n=1 Tax=Sulfitobacter sp. M368 TaxID=2867021 RepID=UPI0021A65789|nr:LysR family transcriptional regulator [Sulfitobacter sp. M368]UWR17467.1 LysR family transcriptional regulator [Sulfitobacter sp. M368]
MQLIEVSMRLEWLEDILSVLDSGSFNAAAETRFLTPSAFTRRIRSIETALGCELFDRSRKPIVLHPHALDCVPEMRDAVAALKTVSRRLSDPQDALHHRITLVCQHTLTASWAPTLVAFVSRDQAVNVRVKSGTKSDCLLSLVKREAQFALTYEAKDEVSGFDPEFSDRILLGQEMFVPVANLVQNPELVDDLAARRVPIISYPTSVFLGEVQRKMIQFQADPKFAFVSIAETGLGLAVVEFVKRGLGIGWVPQSLIGDELAAGELTLLTDTLPGFTLDITLTRLTGTQPKHAEALWSMVRDGPEIADMAN